MIGGEGVMTKNNENTRPVFITKKPSRNEQNKMVLQEIDRLNYIFKDIPDNKRMIAKELIERVAFMTIQMRVMENTIKMKGPTYLFKNGSQRMLIENPAQKSYNTTMNRYTAAYKMLFDLLNDLKDDDDGYEDI